MPSHASLEGWVDGVPMLSGAIALDLLRMSRVVLERPGLAEVAQARSLLGAETMAGLGLMYALPRLLPERPPASRSWWRRRFTIACLCWRICPERPYAAIAAGLLHDLPSAIDAGGVAGRWGLGDEVIAAVAGTGRLASAVRFGHWLALLKRIGPLVSGHPDLDPADITALGLGPDGLVAVLVDLTGQADRARRLSRIVLERR